MYAIVSKESLDVCVWEAVTALARKSGETLLIGWLLHSGLHYDLHSNTILHQFPKYNYDVN